MVLLSFSLLFLTGCSSIQNESNYIPLNRQPYSRLGYRTGEVVYGDITNRITLELKGDNIEDFPTKSNLDNPELEKVYVEEGDYVHKGQILAEFKMEKLQDELDSYRFNVFECENELERLHKLYDADFYYAYGTEIRDAEDNLTIAKARLAELENRTSDYRLVAPVDGVVTRISEDIYKDNLAKNTNLITVTTQPRFYVCTNDINYNFNIGDVFHGKTGIIESDFTLVSYNETENMLYFTTNTDLYTVNSRMATDLEVSSETLQNQLYVEKNMIQIVNGIEYLYVLNDNDLFTPKEIKTEKIFGDYAVISGDVKAGDTVCIK